MVVQNVNGVTAEIPLPKEEVFRKRQIVTVLMVHWKYGF